MRSKTCTEPNPTKPPTHHTKPQIIVKNSHPIFKNLVTTREASPHHSAMVTSDDAVHHH